MRPEDLKVCPEDLQKVLSEVQEMREQQSHMDLKLASMKRCRRFSDEPASSRGLFVTVSQHGHEAFVEGGAVRTGSRKRAGAPALAQNETQGRPKAFLLNNEFLAMRASEIVVVLPVRQEAAIVAG